MLPLNPLMTTYTGTRSDNHHQPTALRHTVKSLPKWL